MAKAHETLERKDLYDRLKRRTMDGTKESFFKLFGIEGRKRRKHTLARLVWSEEATCATADASAQVIMGTFDADLHGRDWVEELRAARIRRDVLSTVQACLLSIQHHKDLMR